MVWNNEMKKLFFFPKNWEYLKIHSHNEETSIYNLGIVLFFNFQNELVSPHKFVHATWNKM